MTAVDILAATIATIAVILGPGATTLLLSRRIENHHEQRKPPQ